MSIMKKRSFSPMLLFIERLKNPLTLLLLMMTLIIFVLADHFYNYILGTMMFALTIASLYLDVIDQKQLLNARLISTLERFHEDAILLSNPQLLERNNSGNTNYILISPKGIFNIKALDFYGSLKGDVQSTHWQFIDAIRPTTSRPLKIYNPIIDLKRNQQAIKAYLEKHHLKYLYIHSLIVINNFNAYIDIDTDFPIIKVKELDAYISKHSDRSTHINLENHIIEALVS